MYAGFSLYYELALLVRSSVEHRPKHCRAQQSTPARFLGMEKDLGTIEKGKVANLVLLDADPLADIHNTTKIFAVFLEEGREFDRRCAGRDVERVRKPPRSRLSVNEQDPEFSRASP